MSEENKVMQMQQMQEMKQGMQQMQEQLQLLNHQMQELEQVKDSIIEMKSVEVGDEVLMSLGAGVFGKATVKDNNKIILKVGANVAVEKDLDGAEKLVKRQIEELKNVEVKINEEFANISQQMQFLQMQKEA